MSGDFKGNVHHSQDSFVFTGHQLVLAKLCGVFGVMDLPLHSPDLNSIMVVVVPSQLLLLFFFAKYCFQAEIPTV